MDIYRERAHLVAHLSSLYPATIGHTDPDEPLWNVVTIETPAGQMAWHIADADVELFDHLRWPEADTPRWDGHTTTEKYARLRALTKGEPAVTATDRTEHVPSPTNDMLRFFEYKHLPPHLAGVSREFAKLAHWIHHALPPGAETTTALRKVLEAKDAAVRAALPTD